MSEAMDGRREAHREVLVAVFGQKGLMPQPPAVAFLGKRLSLPLTLLAGCEGRERGGFDSHRTTR